MKLNQKECQILLYFVVIQYNSIELQTPLLHAKCSNNYQTNIKAPIRMYANSAMNQQLWDRPLVEILKMGDTINTFALALGKSRYQIMTHQLATELGSAARRHDKWLQVVKRVIEKDYFKAFQFCIQDDNLLLPLIAVYFTQPKSSSYYEQHSVLIYKRALSIIGEPSSQPSVYLAQIKNLQLYTELSLKHNQTSILKQLFNTFCSYSNEVNNLLSHISTIYDPLNKNQDGQEAWDFHQFVVRLFRDIVRLVAAMEDLAVRKLWVNQFDACLSRNNNGLSMKQIIGDKIRSVVELLSRRITKIESRDINKLAEYYSDLCSTILAFSKIEAVESFIRQNESVLRLLVWLAESINIFSLNNYSNLSEEVLAINDEVSSRIFSDTLAGIFMRMVISLCVNIGPFFNLYLEMLIAAFTRGKMHQLRSQQFINLLLKVTLLSDQILVSSRKYELERLLDTVNNAIAPHWQSYDQWQQLQILRYFIVFTGTINNREQSAQELISKCVVLCFQCLAPLNQSIKQHDQLSPIQLQSQNLLQILPDQPKNLELIKKCLLPTILQQFLKISHPSITILQLFNTYMTKVPEIISRSSEYIIDYMHKIFERQVANMHHRSNNGLRVKCTPRILKVLRILCTIIEEESELRFEDIQEKIVGSILIKLCDPYSIQYQQQLLDLFELVLEKHGHLSAEICKIISKLPVIYQKNQKKLSIVGNIYGALAKSNHVRDEILYEYPDIVKIMLQMFVDYVRHVLTVEQFLYYRDEIRALMWNVQLFINKFASTILEDTMLINMVGMELFEAFFLGLQNTIKYINQYNKTHQYHVASNSGIYYEFQELQTQFFMTISHLMISPEAQSLNLTINSTTVQILKNSSPSNFKYFETVRMIPVILIDQMFIQPDNHENIVSDLIKFCEVMSQKEMEWGINREWGKIQGIGEWDLWPSKAKDYVENVLREMRNRKLIDQVDHSQYLQAICNVLR